MNTSNEFDQLAEMSNELDDLGNLFDFGDIDLNNITSPEQYGEHMQQHGAALQEPNGMSSLLGTSAQDYGENLYGMSGVDSQHFDGQHTKFAPSSSAAALLAMYHPSVQQPHNQYSQGLQSQQEQAYRMAHHIPPTPNSLEMHGETGHFMHQNAHLALDPRQQAILEQRYGLRKDDAVAFTPMVSPAGTPQYSILPDFTTPGAYFSPLTSPLLHAQYQQHLRPQQHTQRLNASTAPSSHTNSPIDLNIDIDMLDSMSQPPSTGPTARKSSRRKPVTSRTTGASAKARQSPAQTSQKRKSVSLSIPRSNAEYASSTAAVLQPSSAGLQLPSQFESSEAESISPETLSESVMGPPPRPSTSTHASPALIGQQPKSGAPAATPKSILTMRALQQPQIDGQPSATQTPALPSDEMDLLDDLALPEAASKPDHRKPPLSRIDTKVDGDSTTEHTPRLSARKTPKLGPESTPARPGSAVASPSVTGRSTTASTPDGMIKDGKEGKNSRGGRKRGSMSVNGSTLTSPALVPKISPSIKPLLPEGTTLNSATQAMLLASKSNYQNILEGNHLPGVTYPDSLSTGLTSKRTSHKVAEQGRRNRINDALKEMQALIPKSASSKSPEKDSDNLLSGSPEDGDDDQRGDSNSKESKEDAAVKSSSSKAATVELANEYIKKMQQDHAMQDASIMKLMEENEKLKQRLATRSGSPAARVEDAS